MKKIGILTIFLLGIGVMGIGINSAIAQPVDEEEQLDDAIQQFGYMSGVVFQCAANNKADAITIERDAMKAFTGITRLFGSDRAFYYAAAYGVGATSQIDQSKCAEDTRRFQELMKKNVLAKGE